MHIAITRIRRLASAAVLLAASLAASAAEEPIKVGVLHSLSGTMAISETTLKDTVLMMIDEQNATEACSAGRWKPSLSIPPRTGRCLRRKRGNLLKKKPSMCIRLLDVGVAEVRIAGVRGVEQPAVLPVQYEGEESSKNVFYTGAAPNQQAIPAVTT